MTHALEYMYVAGSQPRGLLCGGRHHPLGARPLMLHRGFYAHTHVRGFSISEPAHTGAPPIVPIHTFPISCALARAPLHLPLAPRIPRPSTKQQKDGLLESVSSADWKRAVESYFGDSDVFSLGLEAYFGDADAAAAALVGGGDGGGGAAAASLATTTSNHHEANAGGLQQHRTSAAPPSPAVARRARTIPGMGDSAVADSSSPSSSSSLSFTLLDLPPDMLEHLLLSACSTASLLAVGVHLPHVARGDRRLRRGRARRPALRHHLPRPPHERPLDRRGYLAFESGHAWLPAARARPAAREDRRARARRGRLCRRAPGRRRARPRRRRRDASRVWQYVEHSSHAKQLLERHARRDLDLAPEAGVAEMQRALAAAAAAAATAADRRRLLIATEQSAVNGGDAPPHLADGGEGANGGGSPASASAARGSWPWRRRRRRGRQRPARRRRAAA